MPQQPPNSVTLRTIAASEYGPAGTIISVDAMVGVRLIARGLASKDRVILPPPRLRRPESAESSPPPAAAPLELGADGEIEIDDPDPREAPDVDPLPDIERPHRRRRGRPRRAPLVTDAGVEVE